MSSVRLSEWRITPGWLLVCLSFWGFATDHPIAATAGGALLEFAHVTSFRLALTSRHYERLADFMTAVFAVVVVYAFSTYRVLGIYTVLAGFPWILLPLALAQCYGLSGGVPLSAFVLSVRRDPTQAARTVDLRPVLGVACLLAASATARPATEYGVGIAVALGWLLYAQRRPGNQRYRWYGAAGVALLLAMGTYVTILRAQIATGDMMQQLIARVGFLPTDPGQASTALGALGRLKLSDRIRLRIHAPRNVPLPIRLTEATYQQFAHGTWRNRDQSLVVLDAEGGRRQWRLATGKPTRRFTMTTERTREVGALALPEGALVLSGEDLLEVSRHPHGAIVAEARPGFMRYTVGYAPAQLARPLPGAGDLEVPAPYRPVLSRVVREAGADGLTAAQAVARFEAFFAERFRYSLIQPGYFPGRKPLASFLERDRAGHCEYFATATALLLRQVGVPSRYVVGYVADEYSAREGVFLARARHAHAWVEAFVDGAWRVVDTTPGLWLEAERARGIPWHLAGDLANWIRWQLQRFQRGELRFGPAALAVVPFLAGWLAWRLRPLAARRRTMARSPAIPPAPSTLLPVLAALAREGCAPDTGQTLRAFLPGCRRWHDAALVDRVLSLHYAERYRPRSLDDAEQHELDAGVMALLRELTRMDVVPASRSPGLPSTGEHQ